MRRGQLHKQESCIITHSSTVENSSRSPPYASNAFHYTVTVLVQVFPKGRFGEIISFELDLGKWHRKIPKPLRFRDFLHRYLIRCCNLVAEEGLEPTTFGL